MGDRTSWQREEELRTLIDASTFATHYNAFWNLYTPTCEHFIRRLNLESIERFSTPMQIRKSKGRRAFTAELAFSFWALSANIQSEKDKQQDYKKVAELAWIDAVNRLKLLVDESFDLASKLSEDEQEDVNEIIHRLNSFFDKSHKSLISRPVFNGCGFIDSSEADVVAETTLFEIKTVERTFRGADIRQLITKSRFKSAPISQHWTAKSPKRNIHGESN
jgi:hypothetical protein